MEFRIRSITSGSKLHKKNEDTYFVGDGFIIVADGMGGECNGDIASRLAVDTMIESLSESLPYAITESDIHDVSFRAIEKADAKIVEYINRNPDSFGMGTTVLLAVMRDDIIYISWCGDSHCYVYRDSELSSITKDHSYVQQLIDSGQITIDESFTHPYNNLITKFVGGGMDTCSPDFLSHRVTDSEILILCSDGLSGYCKYKDIAKTIRSNHDIEKMPEQLFELAILHGSDDDITIVVVDPKPCSCKKRGKSFFEWFRRLARFVKTDNAYVTKN